jgi:hypothetical protein
LTMTRLTKWYIQQVQAGTQTKPAFKVEQSKILEFFGQKNKATILALNFIRRIDDLTRTNNSSDMVTYSNVANTLRGFAHKWLFSTVDMLEYTADQLTWTNIKPRFQMQFAVQSDDKLIIEGISNLGIKPTETTGDLANRVTDTIVIIRESYTAYQNKVAAP